MATPVATATLDEPFEPEFELRALAPDERDAELRLPDEELRLRDDELPPRDDAADDLRLEALALLRFDALALLRLDALELFGLLREADDCLLREADDLPREAEDLVFGLDPFELVDPDFRFVWERELAWAIAPP